MSEDFISYKCSACKNVVGYAPKSVIEFMKLNNFLDTYKCYKCKQMEQEGK